MLIIYRYIRLTPVYFMVIVINAVTLKCVFSYPEIPLLLVFVVVVVCWLSVAFIIANKSAKCGLAYMKKATETWKQQKLSHLSSKLNNSIGIVGCCCCSFHFYLCTQICL